MRETSVELNPAVETTLARVLARVNALVRFREAHHVANLLRSSLCSSLTDNGMETEEVLVHASCCKKLGMEVGESLPRKQVYTE